MNKVVKITDIIVYYGGENKGSFVELDPNHILMCGPKRRAERKHSCQFEADLPAALQKKKTFRMGLLTTKLMGSTRANPDKARSVKNNICSFLLRPKQIKE